MKSAYFDQAQINPKKASSLEIAQALQFELGTFLEPSVITRTPDGNALLRFPTSPRSEMLLLVTPQGNVIARKSPRAPLATLTFDTTVAWVKSNMTSIPKRRTRIDWYDRISKSFPVADVTAHVVPLAWVSLYLGPSVAESCLNFHHVPSEEIHTIILSNGREILLHVGGGGGFGARPWEVGMDASHMTKCSGNSRAQALKMAAAML